VCQPGLFAELLVSLGSAGLAGPQLWIFVAAASIVETAFEGSPGRLLAGVLLPKPGSELALQARRSLRGRGRVSCAGKKGYPLTSFSAVVDGRGGPLGGGKGIFCTYVFGVFLICMSL
jgi:hypothetical protein